MKLSKSQRELIVEKLTGVDAEALAISYLLEMKTIKKDTPQIRKAVQDFLSSVRVDLGDLAEYG